MNNNLSKKVRIGILGCADVARRQAIPAFKVLDNAEVVSIASRSLEKAKEWARDFSITSAATYESLLADKEVDAIYVPLPVGLHKEWVIKAARSGKHVICEKSLAKDFVSAADMVHECRKNGVVLYENLMCGFHPQHRAVSDIISSGRIGQPHLFRGYFGFPPLKPDNIRYKVELGGGALNDAGAYPVFMARKIFNSEPTFIAAHLDYDNGVDVRGEALLEFEGGRSALIAFSFCAIYQNNYSVWARSGTITVNRAYSIPADMSPDIDMQISENGITVSSKLDTVSANQFELIFDDFCGTILRKAEKMDYIKNLYSDILLQARVMEAIRISSEEHRMVDVRNMGIGFKL